MRSRGTVALEREVSKAYLSTLSPYANWYDQSWYYGDGARVRSRNERLEANRNLPLQSSVGYRPPPLHHVPSLKRVTAHRKRESKKDTLFWINAYKPVLLCLLDVDGDDPERSTGLADHLVKRHLAGHGYVDPSPGGTGRHVYFLVSTERMRAGEVVDTLVKWEKLIKQDRAVAEWAGAKFCCLLGHPTIWQRTSEVVWEIKRRGTVVKAPYFPSFDRDVSHFKSMQAIPLSVLRRRLGGLPTTRPTTSKAPRPRVASSLATRTPHEPSHNPPPSQNVLMRNSQEAGIQKLSGHRELGPQSDAQALPPSDNPNTTRRMTAGWGYVRKHGHVPTADQLLQYIQDNALYSPPWEFNEAKRRADVEGIVLKLAALYSPQRSCYNYNRLAKQLLQGHRIPFGKKGVIHWEDVSIFLSVLEECIIRHPNPDGSVPRDRVERLWPSVARRKHSKRKWHDAKYPAMREFLLAMGVLEMVDEEWSTGKAMRYTIGPEHPQFGSVERIMLAPVDPSLVYDGQKAAETYCYPEVV